MSKLELASPGKYTVLSPMARELAQWLSLVKLGFKTEPTERSYKSLEQLKIIMSASSQLSPMKELLTEKYAILARQNTQEIL